MKSKIDQGIKNVVSEISKEKGSFIKKRKIFNDKLARDYPVKELQRYSTLAIRSMLRYLKDPNKADHRWKCPEGSFEEELLDSKVSPQRRNPIIKIDSTASRPDDRNKRGSWSKVFWDKLGSVSDDTYMKLEVGTLIDRLQKDESEDSLNYNVAELIDRLISDDSANISDIIRELSGQRTEPEGDPIKE